MDNLHENLLSRVNKGKSTAYLYRERVGEKSLVCGLRQYQVLRHALYVRGDGMPQAIAQYSNNALGQTEQHLVFDAKDDHPDSPIRFVYEGDGQNVTSQDVHASLFGYFILSLPPNKKLFILMLSSALQGDERVSSVLTFSNEDIDAADRLCRCLMAHFTGVQ